MTPATAILIPVLNRPEKVVPLVENIEAVTPEPHRILFLVSEGDTDEASAIDHYEQLGPVSRVTVDDPGTWARKINWGFTLTDEPYVFLAADDLKFHRHWLEVALEVAQTLDGVADRSPYPGIVGTNDLCNDRSMRGLHSTHSLVRRSYVDSEGGTVDQGPGVVLFPDYPHDYADDELVETAKSRGVYAHATLSGVEHLHPLCGKAPMDETYELGMQVGPGPGRRLYKSREHLWNPNATGRMAQIGRGYPRRPRRGR